MTEHSRRILEAMLLVFIVNVPFGYWRARARRLSLQWLLAIHIPVLFTISCRYFLDIGWQFITFPILIGAFITGQFAGGKLRQMIANLH